jgi:tetratricopeptide (TPR) repeat protein
LEEENPNPALGTVVYRTIREYVARNDPDGLKYIQSLEKNLGTAHESARTREFTQYLEALLSKGPGLQDELIASAGADNQFVTIVTGGQVEKIVNIAKAGAVHIHQSHYLITFRSFVLLLSVVVTAFLIIFGIYWKSKQPTILIGDFKIAVATFGTSASAPDPDTAENISQAIYELIDREFNSPQQNNLEIDVGHENIGVISGQDHAEQLAQSIHADIIVYGTLTAQGDDLVIAPRFYIADSIKADAGELIGSHQLELPQGLKTGDFNVLPTEGSKARETLLQNSEILIYFTKGLTFLVLSEKDPAGKDNYLRLALESIRTAIKKSEELHPEGDATGNEVLYLFASHASFLRGDQESAQTYIDTILSINDCYGRAYIARGNVFYAMGISAHAEADAAFEEYFDQAIDSYEYALDLDAGHADCEVQPYGYYLPAKAYIGLGNVYSFLFQVAPSPKDPALADKALHSFDQVIAAHTSLPAKDPGRALLTTLAANAHYQSGVIFLIQENSAAAIERFHRVITLAACTPLAAKAKAQLERLGEVVRDSCGDKK